MHFDTGVILIGDVITIDRCLILTVMKGCHISKWSMGT